MLIFFFSHFSTQNFLHKIHTNIFYPIVAYSIRFTHVVCVSKINRIIDKLFKSINNIEYSRDNFRNVHGLVFKRPFSYSNSYDVISPFERHHDIHIHNRIIVYRAIGMFLVISHDISKNLEMNLIFSFDTTNEEKKDNTEQIKNPFWISAKVSKSIAIW